MGRRTALWAIAVVLVVSTIIATVQLLDRNKDVEVQVTVGITVCRSADCVITGVPDCMVTLTDPNGIELKAVTGADGVATFNTAVRGAFDMRAESPLLGGLLRTSLTIGPDDGYVSVDLVDPNPVQVQASTG